MASEEYTFDLIRDPSGFERLAPEWDDLYARCSPSNPCVSHAWASACWDAQRDQVELFVVTARRDGRLVGLAPLRRERYLGLRRLTFLGRGLSPYIAFLCDGSDAGIEQALFRGLSQHRGEWDLLRLDQLSEPFTALHRADQVPGIRLLQQPCPWKGSSYYAAAEGSDITRLSWLREAKRRLNKLEEAGGTIRRYCGPEADGMVDAILSIESRSWQGRYGQNGSNDKRARLGTFYREAFRRLGRQREIELWLAWMDGTPIAYRVTILTPERVWLYRSSYDEKFGQFSPGCVLDLMVIRQAWEEGRREYDYLSGGEAYKSQRTNSVRALMRLTAASPTLRGSVGYGIAMAEHFLNGSERLRELLQFLSRVRKSPKSLLPWNRTVQSRVHH
jgi:CelD/BcsL family acetyltransferase involved in cellulose biosynthesis